MTDESYDCRAEFKKNLEKAVQQYTAEGRDVDTGLAPNQQHPSQRPVPQPNAELLKQADELQAQKDENGNRLYVTDSQFREKVEAIRRRAYGGDAPATAPQQQGAKQPAQETAEPAAEPTGDPVERLEQALSQDDFAELTNVSSEDQIASLGYDLSRVLPDGFGIDSRMADELRAARDANIPQSIVERFARELVRREVGQ